MDTCEDRMPVTLLTGFLGAGKTTLLNKLIQDPEAGRIAVIMNEFGDVGLDHDLIEEATNEVILMQSGCLCCTFRGDIVKTLVSLMARLKRGELSFDRIVIETTGIADPAPIMHTLLLDDLVARHFRFDGVVTVADAATGSNALNTHAEAVSQIAMADLIVVTKTDIATAEDLARFEQRMDGINATAPRLYAAKGPIPTGRFFDLSAMRDTASADEIAQWLGQGAMSHETTHGHGDHGHSHNGHAHDDHGHHDHGHHDHGHHDHGHHDHHDHSHHHHNHDQIVSASIELWEPISSTVFDFWLDVLMALKGPDILRMKGIVHVEEMEHPFVFHGVQHIFDVPVPLKSWTGVNTTSRVVLIARNMSKEELVGSLDILRMQPKEVEQAATSAAEPVEMPF